MMLDSGNPLPKKLCYLFLERKLQTVKRLSLFASAIYKSMEVMLMTDSSKCMGCLVNGSWLCAEAVR